MNKKVGAHLLGIITVVMIMSSCTKDYSYSHDSSYFGKGYYFKGKIFGKDKLFKDGVNSFFNDFRNGYDAGWTHGYTEFGIAKPAPTQPGDEQIYVAAASEGVSSARDVDKYLVIGKQPFYMTYVRGGLGVTYFLNDSTGTKGCAECSVQRVFTTLGPQDGMTIEVLSIQPVDYTPVNGSQKFEIAVRINCKLYDLNGNYVGNIQNGLLVSQVLVAI